LSSFVYNYINEIREIFVDLIDSKIIISFMCI